MSWNLYNYVLHMIYTAMCCMRLIKSKMCELQQNKQITLERKLKSKANTTRKEVEGV